jgi:predicted dehydrogenase
MSATNQTLNIAMIGHGFIARAHSNAFVQVSHFFDTPYRLIPKIICGRNREQTEAMASRWGWQEVASDWRSVIDRPDIQVVDIATPNALHAPIALAAAAAGKMVWCEKPLAMSVEEAEAMAAAVKNIPNLVWFNYRRIPAVAFAKILLDEGRLGQIYHYRGLYLNQSGNNPAKTSGWRYKRAQAGSGALGDLLSHAIDFALYLNGPIADFAAMMHTFAPGRDVDDAVALLARFSNGSVGTFEATRYGVGCRNRNAFEIHGSRGMLAFDLERMDRLEFLDATDAPELQAARDIMVTGPNHPYWENFWKPGHQIGYEHTFIATLGDFLQSLARSEAFHPNFEDALRVQKILEAIEWSASSASWVKL